MGASRLEDGGGRCCLPTPKVGRCRVPGVTAGNQLPGLPKCQPPGDDTAPDSDKFDNLTNSTHVEHIFSTKLPHANVLQGQSSAACAPDSDDAYV
jgi:hypothetical protein